MMATNYLSRGLLCWAKTDVKIALNLVRCSSSKGSSPKTTPPKTSTTQKTSAQPTSPKSSQAPASKASAPKASAQSSSPQVNIPVYVSKATPSPPSQPVGPGASKSGDYKNTEYFSYNQESYYDLEVEMVPNRLPQPKANNEQL